MKLAAGQVFDTAGQAAHQFSPQSSMPGQQPGHLIGQRGPGEKTLIKAPGAYRPSLSLRGRHRMRAFPRVTQPAEGFVGACSVGAPMDVVVARLVAHVVYGLCSLGFHCFRGHDGGDERQKISWPKSRRSLWRQWWICPQTRFDKTSRLT